MRKKKGKKSVVTTGVRSLVIFAILTILVLLGVTIFVFGPNLLGFAVAPTIETRTLELGVTANQYTEIPLTLDASSIRSFSISGSSTIANGSFMVSLRTAEGQSYLVHTFSSSDTFPQTFTFENVCADTCFLDTPLNVEGLMLVIAVDRAEVVIDNITYDAVILPVESLLPETPISPPSPVPDVPEPQGPKVVLRDIHGQEIGSEVIVEPRSGDATIAGTTATVHILPTSGPVNRIVIHDVPTEAATTTVFSIDDLEDVATGEYTDLFAINPEEFSFYEATITFTAEGTDLYKCADWNFDERRCDGDWVLVLSGMAIGNEYSVTISASDPGFAQKITSCVAEDSTAKGAFSGSCDGTYPGACGASGDLLACNDALTESHTAGGGSLYGGIRVLQFNTSETGCTSVTNVSVCFEVWLDTGFSPTDCDISIDNQNLTNFTAINTTCPGTTADPGVTCQDVTSMKAWTCSNFFGSSGNRSAIKSEMTRTVGGTKTAFWDVLFYNVTYGVTATGAAAPANQTVELGADTTLTWTINGSGGYYYVERNGTLFYGPAAWTGSSATIVIRPNTFFLGNWNYTLYFNETASGTSSNSATTINVVDQIVPSCSQVVGQTGAIVQKNITIDGDVRDWDAVVRSGANLVNDTTLLTGDPDQPDTSVRDMINFAHTFDSQYMYFLFRRFISGTAQASLIVYLDRDGDGKMETGENVVKFTWSGSTRKYDATLHNYVPANVTGDVMHGDGSDMPGSITDNGTVETNVLGGADPGVQLETRLPWSAIGESQPRQLNIKAAIARGSGTNLPDQLTDNIGNTTSTANFFVLFQDSQSKSTLNGTTAYFNHEIMNCGNNLTTIEFTNASSQTWPITLLYPNGSETPISDTDADGTRDMTLRSGQFTSLIVRRNVPSNASIGSVDRTNVTASSPTNNKTLTETLSIEGISLSPETKTLFGTASLNLSTNFTVSNFQAADVIDIKATSSNGWVVNITLSNGSFVRDSDADGLLDLGQLSFNELKDIVVIIRIPPGVAEGTTDLTRIVINSSNSPSVTDTSFINTTVKQRLVLDPGQYNETVTGGDTRFYLFTVTNNFNLADTVDLKAVRTLGWNVTFLDSSFTELTDSDSDGLIDTGSLSGGGGNLSFYARVIVPQNTTLGQNESITVFANSSLNTAIYNSSNISLSPRGISVFNDSARTVTNSRFRITQSVYVRGFNLQGVSQVYFVWYDGLNETRRSGNVTPTSGVADDSIDTNVSQGLGSWTVIMVQSSGDTEIGRSNFEVYDDIFPNVTLVSPVNGSTFNISTTIEVAVNVSDNYGVSAVLANISFSNGTILQKNLSFVGGEKYNATFTIPLLVGSYNITFIANDTSNNTNSSVRTFFTVTDPNPPLVFDLVPTSGSSFNVSSTIEIAANVTDDIAVSFVYANMTYPNGSRANVTLSLVPGTNKYNGSFIIASGGTYTARFIANDSSNNINASQQTTFSGVGEQLGITFISPTPANTSFLASSFFTVNASLSTGGTIAACMLDFDSQNSSMTLTGTTCNRTVTSLSDGTHTFRVYANLTSGFTNVSEARIVIVDTVFPLISYVAPTESNASLLIRSNIQVNVSVTDTNFANVTIFLYNSSGIVNTSTSSSSTFFVNFTSLPDGTYFFNATTYDLAGNKNTTVQRTVSIDTLTPLVQFVSPTEVNGTYLSRSNVLVNVTVSDANFANVTIFLYNASGVLNTTTSTSSPFFVNFTSLPDGTYFFNATVYDVAGNRNVTEVRTVIVDTVRPLLEFVSPTDTSGAIVTRSYVLVNVSVSDTNLANVTIRLYNSTSLLNSTTSTSSPFFVNFTSLPDGTYFFNATTLDLAGNVNSTETRNMTIDTAVPVISFVGPTPGSGGFISASEIAINVTASDANFANVTIRLYNSTSLLNTTTSASSPFFVNFSSLPDGIYFFNATTYDVAGNVNTTETRNITIDTTKPVPVFVASTETSGSVITRSYVLVNVSVSDVNFANVTVRLYNSSALLNTTTSTSSPYFVNFTGLPDGIYLLNATAVDLASNSNSTETRNVTIDTTAPLVTVVHPIQNTSFNVSEIISITANVTDAVGVSAVYANITFPNGTVQVLQLSLLSAPTYNTTFTIPALFGRYNITFIANDTTNHINSSVTTFFIANDSLAPQVTGTIPATGSQFNTSTSIEIGANVTDNFNVSTVLANISFPNGSSQILVLTRYDATNKYNATFAIPSVEGTYTIRYIANDTNNNVNSSVTTTFFTTDNDPPLVFALIPTAGSPFNITETIEIGANVTDTTGVSSVRANLTFPNGTLQVLTLTRVGSTDKYNTSFTIPVLIGRYNLTFIANDSANNFNTSATTFFVGNDSIPPSVVDISPTAGTQFNLSTNIEISANVTDMINVSAVYANITFPNGTTRLLVLARYDATAKYNTSFSIPVLLGQFNITYIANDTNNNVNQSVTTFFISNDTIPPSVFDVVPAANTSFSASTSIEIAANITDNFNVSSAYTNVTLPNGTVQQVNLSFTSGNKFNVSYAISTVLGRYNITYVARDSNGNANASQTSFFIAVSPDSTSPIVTLVGPENNSVDTNGQITFQYNVTDASSVSSCLLFVNGTQLEQNSSITRNTTQSFDLSGLGNGRYQWFVNCTDVFGNSGVSRQFVVNVSLPGNVSTSLIINETIQNANGVVINATIELIDFGSGQTDVNTSTGTQRNISAGRYNIRITPQGLPIISILFYNVTVTTNITEVTDLDAFSLPPFVNPYAVNPNLTNFTYYNITVLSVTGDAFKCANWNFTGRACIDNLWIKVADVAAGANYTVSVRPGDPGFVENNQTINVITINDNLIFTNQTVTHESGFFVNVTVVPSGTDNRFVNITIKNFNTSSANNDLKIDTFVNDTGWPVRLLIDPSRLAFVNGTVTRTANKTSFWKCTNYNFTEEACAGGFTFVRTLTAGANYTITISSSDPVFIEQPDDLAGIDTYVSEFSNDTNFGTSDQIRLDGRTDMTERGLLLFNLSSIPARVRIDSATVELYRYSGQNNELSIDAVRVTQSWNETNVTWNTRPSFDSNVYASVTVNGSNGTHVWNVTQLARGWYNGSFTNYGLYLKPSSESAGATNKEKRFYSSDTLVNTSLRPILRISYSADAIVSLLSPADAATITSTPINFTCNASTANFTSLANITFYTNTGGSFAALATANVSGTDNETTFTISNVSAGTYTWNCYATTLNATAGFASANRTFTFSVSGNVTTPTTGGGGGGGGGGEGVPQEECAEDWECTEWGSCVSGIQARTCTDTSNCGDDSTKPTEERSCEACTPDWECSDWDTSACPDGGVTRTCVDSNDCGTEYGKPSEAEGCSRLLAIAELPAFVRERPGISLFVAVLASLLFGGLAVMCRRTRYRKHVETVRIGGEQHQDIYYDTDIEISGCGAITVRTVFYSADHNDSIAVETEDRI